VLNIRIHRGEVRNVSEHLESKTVKAGGTTYFFDVKKAKDGKLYLAITASRFKGEKEERERATIYVFPDHAKDFLMTTQEMIAQLQ
jgi:hypothetical protein